MASKSATRRLWVGVADLFPGLHQIRRYERAWLRGDVLAGITVAAYLIPQVMAYAEVAGVPAVAGLWAAIGSLAIYAFVGSSRQLSVGPESTTALMTAAAVGPLAAGDPSRYAALAAALGIVVGLMCFLGWAIRLGFLADLLSKPVLVGYMAGVAVIMITSQLGKVIGVRVEGESFLAEMNSFVRHVHDAHLPTLAMAGGVLVFLLGASRLAPRTPAPLIGMLLATAAVFLLDLDRSGLAVVGDIPAGLPVPELPDIELSSLASLLLPAVGVAVVGYSDNALTARAFATRNRYSIDANQELFALGAANVASGLMKGFPVSSSGSRTVIGDTLGSRTQLYSLIGVAAVILTLFFGRPVLARFPAAALGAIVIWAALRLVDVAEFQRLARFRRSEFLLSLATAGSVLVFDILYGVLIAVALSIVDLLRRVARPHDGILGYVPGVPGMHDIDDYPGAKLIPGLVVYRYDSPLFFANAENFKRRALASIEIAESPVEWFVLNAEANVEVDITSIDALEDIREELAGRGVFFALARVKQELWNDLDAAGFIDRVGADHIFATLPTAVQAYLRWYVDRHGAAPPGVVAVPELPLSPLDPQTRGMPESGPHAGSGQTASDPGDPGDPGDPQRKPPASEPPA